MAKKGMTVIGFWRQFLRCLIITLIFFLMSAAAKFRQAFFWFWFFVLNVFAEMGRAGGRGDGGCGGLLLWTVFLGLICILLAYKLLRDFQEFPFPFPAPQQLPFAQVHEEPQR